MRRLLRPVILPVAIVLAGTVIGRARPVGAAAPPEMAPPVFEPRSVEDVEDAPPPTEASGIEVPRSRAGEGWLLIPRALLLVPRWTVIIALSPVRLGMWAHDRYDLAERWERIFFNDEGTVGLFPSAFAETGFGLNAGVRLVHRDLWGGRLRARAGFGGRQRQAYELVLGTGSLLGEDFELELRGSYESFLGSQFFGYGNADERARGPDEPVDPRLDSLAVETRYRHDDAKLAAAVVSRHLRPLSIGLSVQYLDVEFADYEGSFGGRDISGIYDPATLPGFRENLSTLQTELAIELDTRRVTRFYLSEAAPSTGWRITATGALERGLGDDPTALVRYGLDVLRYVDVHAGDRVLLLRGYFEGVTGALDEVPFTALPTLGGPLLLRGYDRGRFRDRYAGMLSVEYDYPVSRELSAFVAVDAGRVWRAVDDIGWRGARVAFGGGVQLHTIRSFLARAQLFSSVDGGLFAGLSFDPVHDVRSSNPLL